MANQTDGCQLLYFATKQINVLLISTLGFIKDNGEGIHYPYGLWISTEKWVSSLLMCQHIQKSVCFASTELYAASQDQYM